MENADKLAALTASVSQYKKADITMPEEGKYYQILSASTYYKAKYEGSSLYASDNNVRFHYTKQYEPEEIWQFEATTGGYKVKNVLTGKALTMPTSNAENMTLTANGSVMKLRSPPKPADNTPTFLPCSTYLLVTNTSRPTAQAMPRAALTLHSAIKAHGALWK